MAWRKYIQDEPGAALWGPSPEELDEVRAERRTAGRGEDKYFDEAEEEDFETLEAMENADVYRGAYDSSGSDED